MHKPSPTTPKQEWIARALEAHERSLVTYATRLLGGDEDRGRDVVQDTFLRLCNQRREAVEHHLREWLFTVTRNRVLDVRRKESRMSPLTAVESRPTEAAASDPAIEAIDRGDEARGIFARMEHLSEKQREVLRLKFQHGLSYKEIAAVMNETIGNVGWWIHSGIKSLKEKLAERSVEA